jgi:outer membrane lipoprotein-sorting protein
MERTDDVRGGESHMSFLSSRPVMRWLVPATAAAAVIGGGAAIGTLATAAEPTLPPRSAAQLLVDLQTARLDGLSGTVVQRAELGLPPIADLAGLGGQGLGSLLSGKNTLRVWYAGPEQARIALMGTLGESDIIRNGDDLWVWNSRTKEATHTKLTGPLAGQGTPEPLPSGLPDLPSTPQEAADLALRAIDPSTEVSVDRTGRVAGRDAYQLVLRPRDKASLVGQIKIAIDATEHLPLRFQVFPKGANDVAFEAAFTQISFDRPDPGQFEFNPPPGTTVKEETAAPEEKPGVAPGDKPGVAPAEKPGVAPREKPGDKPRAEAGGPDDEPRTVGTGWTTVVVAEVGNPAQGGGSEAQQAAGILEQLPRVSGAWGSGRLLSGTLFSVLLTDDGRVLGGFVSPERLYEVAGTTR